MKKKLLLLVALGAIVFVVIQFVPVERGNPPVTGDVGAPSEVRDILRASCYDCHSYETRWPFYAYIAPGSWLVGRDVRRGRAVMNLSTWEGLGREEKLEALRKSWNQIAKGTMPLGIYLLANPQARLDERKKEVLREWITREVTRLEDAGAGSSPAAR